MNNETNALVAYQRTTAQVEYYRGLWYSTLSGIFASSMPVLTPLAKQIYDSCSQPSRPLFPIIP